MTRQTRLVASIFVALTVGPSGAAADEEPTVASSLEPGSLGFTRLGVRAGLFANADGPTGLEIGVEATLGLGRVDLGAGIAYTPDLSECDGEGCFGFTALSISAQAMIATWHQGRARLGARVVGQEVVGESEFILTALVRLSFSIGAGKNRGFVDAMGIFLDDAATPAAQIGIMRGNRAGVFASLGLLAIGEDDAPMPMFSIGLMAH